MELKCLVLIAVHQVVSSLGHKTKNTTNLSRQEILHKFLNTSRYDSSIPPDFELNIPTNITVQLMLLNIHSVSETSMEYSIDIILRQIWKDNRLAYGTLTSLHRLELDTKVMDKVWTPDTFFLNEKNAFVHNVTIPNKLMHLHRNGTIVYSMRVSLTLVCSMLLQKYPLDRQRCPIFIESYAYTVSNTRYYWKTPDPVEIAESVEMPQFEPERHVVTSDCTKNYSQIESWYAVFCLYVEALPNFRTGCVGYCSSYMCPFVKGRFSCIHAEIILTRKVGYYIVQIFVPSMLIVVLSWVGFWVDYDAVPARVSLGIMTVLTMTTQSSGAKQSLPHVSYIKALDVWMAVCLLFVFASLLEYAYVNVLARRMFSATVYMDNSNGIPASPEKQRPALQRRDTPKTVIASRRIDKMSRLLFPVSFSLFNLFFWLYYIFSPDPTN